MLLIHHLPEKSVKKFVVFNLCLLLSVITLCNIVTLKCFADDSDERASESSRASYSTEITTESITESSEDITESVTEASSDESATVRESSSDDDVSLYQYDIRFYLLLIIIILLIVMILIVLRMVI